MSLPPFVIYGAVCTWLAVIGAGMSYLAYYSQQPGGALAAPAQIEPLAPTAAQKQRLLMFIHPRCPCSTASLRELQRLMSRCADQIEATLYFIRPEDESDAWVQGHLWDLAQKIPGVTAKIDAGGKLAERFAATTSGAIVVYDSKGTLQFQGGITTARGHEGDSFGKAAISAIAHGESPKEGLCPVYGCPLREGTPPDATKAGELR